MLIIGVDGLDVCKEERDVEVWREEEGSFGVGLR